MDDEVEIVFKFHRLGDWVIYDTGDAGFFSEEAVGVSSCVKKLWNLISGSNWLIIAYWYYGCIKGY